MGTLNLGTFQEMNYVNDLRGSTARFTPNQWYAVLWIALLGVWLPTVNALLPAVATGLLSSGSLMSTLAGFGLVALQGLLVALGAIAMLAATTTKLLGRPPAEIPVRAIWALPASFAFLAAATLAVPIGGWLLLEMRFTLLDLPILALLLVLVAWSSLYTAAASELGARQALRATLDLLRRDAWSATGRAGVVIALLVLTIAALSPLANVPFLFVYLASAAAAGCAALSAFAWDSLRRAVPERRSLRPLPGTSAIGELRRVLLLLVAGGERI